MAAAVRRLAVDPAIRLGAANLSRLSKTFEVLTRWPEANENVEGLLIHSRVSESFLRSIPSLEWVGVRAKNTDYAPDVEGIEKFGINSIADIPVAEHAFALMLAIVKKIGLCSNNISKGNWRENIVPLGELAGKTLGIIGYGKIGSRVHKIAEAFEMTTLIAQSPNSGPEGRVPLTELLAESDIISIHVSGKGNEQLIGAPETAMMKPGVILINTTRGYVLDEEAVKEALEEGIISALGIDVCVSEPPACDSYFRHSDKVIFTPHVAFQTSETLEKMNTALVETVAKRYINGY